MKLLQVAALSFLFLSTTSFAKYEGSRFSDVWEQVSSDEYKLPHNKISYKSLFSWAKSKIKNSAERTLSDRSDILPQFDKLAHPNGACLSGKWQITKENPYGGYFKKGSQALIISRASVAMSDTTRGNFRGFGLAGKLFPVVDRASTQKVKTANFFLVDDLGGTKAEHYTDVAMTNEPAVSKTAAVIKNLLYSLKLAATFGKADSNPGIRQLYEISHLGESNLSKVITPKWMKVQALPGQTVDAKDFRDELNMDANDGKIQFSISVASRLDKNGKKKWSRIGNIIFDSSVVSNSCDHRLHFHHPKWNSDLDHAE